MQQEINPAKIEASKIYKLSPGDLQGEFNSRAVLAISFIQLARARANLNVATIFGCLYSFL